MSDWHLLTGHGQLLGKNSIVEYLDLDGALLRLDHRDDVAAFQWVAGLLQPFDQRAGFHVCSERWHAKLDHRRSAFLTASTMPRT
jgi:hypothetical protein